MTEKEYLKELKRNLSALKRSDRNSLIEFYKEMIEDKIENGKTEREAIAELEPADVVAKRTLAEYGIDREKFFSVMDKMADDALASGSPANTIREVTKQAKENKRNDARARHNRFSALDSACNCRACDRSGGCNFHSCRHNINSFGMYRCHAVKPVLFSYGNYYGILRCGNGAYRNRLRTVRRRARHTRRDRHLQTNRLYSKEN